MGPEMPDNKKMAQRCPDGSWKPRIYRRKPKGKKAGGMLIKCGCCEEKLVICDLEGMLEINGVCASIESWRDILMPFLEIREQA